MAYHDDLLQQAIDLANKNATNPTQADLRRAVSSAYYALFHLLISETVVHWNLDSSRNRLARMFEHGQMAKVSKRTGDHKINHFGGEDSEVVQMLRYVAEKFVWLQERRHIADYDNATFWTRQQALDEVATAERAFSNWQAIKQTNIAQDYLVSLLIKH